LRMVTRFREKSKYFRMMGEVSVCVLDQPGWGYIGSYG
jgi:hypothetical protein